LAKIGTLLYQAPEMFEKNSNNEKVGEWALGVIAY